MRLTVLSVAWPFAPVGPDPVGGAEQILSDLDRALVSQGHVSLVAACEGSRPAGRLFAAPLPPAGTLDEATLRSTHVRFQAAIDRALASRKVQVIHMHGFDFHEYSLPPDIPVLVTLHLPTNWYPKDIWERYEGRVLFQFVSEAQRRSGPPALRDSPVVPNGVRLPAVWRARKDDFALALGRVCPEKNVHEALEAGTAAGVRVLLGGRVFPFAQHLKYFAERVQPLLKPKPGGPAHEFLGPLAFARRRRLLTRAKCLLHPTLAPETSSLVAMEAMAAGTPVIAYPSGALPEIVEDGKTGFLVNNVDEMVNAMGRIHTIRPEVCRSTAERRFSGERMTRAYFRLYRMLTAPGAKPLANEDRLYG
ncbi:MAG TPA: glycosyltransferase [Bryobacteraceae bacterium]|nr:glycosyltransferase [Bryobacteraceae bacterium]